MLEVKKLDNGETEITLNMPGFDTYSFTGEGIAYTVKFLATDLADDLNARISSAVALADDVLKEGFSVWLFDETKNGIEYKAGDEEVLRSRLDTNSPPYKNILYRKVEGNESVFFGTMKEKDVDGNDVTFRVFRYEDRGMKTYLDAWRAQDPDDLETKLVSSFFECLLERLWEAN